MNKLWRPRTLLAIFFLIMLSVALILEGLLGISFKGDVPMIVVAGSLLIIGYLALGARATLRPGLASPASSSRPRSAMPVWDFRPSA